MMNTVEKIFVALFCMALTLNYASAAQNDNPVEAVRALSNEVLTAARADTDIQKGNNQKIQALVEQYIVPHVDFQRMTSLAAGRYWRDATPEQQQKMIGEFRSLLIYTYAGALTEIKNQKVEFKRMRADPADTDVIVRSRVIQDNGQEPIAMDYRVEKKDGEWKIYDVNVLGAWMIEAYKDTFSTEIQKGGIDGLIKALAAKNKTLAEKPLKAARKS